jgi:hypothetical protein
MWRPAAAASLLFALSCASAAPSGVPQTDPPVLAASSRVSHWPVEEESRPGLWVRFNVSHAPFPARQLLDRLELVIEHDGRRQVLTGVAFDSMPGAGDSHQTRYYYTPLSGVMFATLQLRSAGRTYHPDTQRIELNDDCWHWLNYRVTGMPIPGSAHPPPHPRTVFLSFARSPETPLYLEVFLTGNCFRNPLPPS